MDLFLFERLAEELYATCGADPTEPESPITLARRWLGPDAIVHAPVILPAPAATFFVEGRRRIAVRPGLPIERRRWAVAHELGHALLAEAGERDSERGADCVGAALIAPYPAVRMYGDNWRDLAFDLGASQTLAALRCAEVLRLPRAIVTPARVYLRGPENWIWPLARRSLERLPGVRKTPLDDAPNRFVLDVDAG